MDKNGLPDKTDELKEGRFNQCKIKRKRRNRLKTLRSLPHVVVEHGLYVPRRAESAEAFAETFVVDGPSVDRKEPHQQNQIPSPKHHPPNLKHTDCLHFHFICTIKDVLQLFCITMLQMSWLIVVMEKHSQSNSEVNKEWASRFELPHYCCSLA